MASTATLTTDVESRNKATPDFAKRNQVTTTLPDRQRMKKKKKSPGGARPGSGRPPAGGKAMGSQIGFRVDDDQRQRWEAAAEAAGLSLSKWIRATCDAAADSAQE